MLSNNRRNNLPTLPKLVSIIADVSNINTSSAGLFAQPISPRGHRKNNCVIASLQDKICNQLTIRRDDKPPITIIAKKNTPCVVSCVTVAKKMQMQ